MIEVKRPRRILQTFMYICPRIPLVLADQICSANRHEKKRWSRVSNNLPQRLHPIVTYGHHITIRDTVDSLSFTICQVRKEYFGTAYLNQTPLLQLIASIRDRNCSHVSFEENLKMYFSGPCRHRRVSSTSERLADLNSCCVDSTRFNAYVLWLYIRLCILTACFTMETKGTPSSLAHLIPVMSINRHNWDQLSYAKEMDDPFLISQRLKTEPYHPTLTIFSIFGNPRYLMSSQTNLPEWDASSPNLSKANHPKRGFSILTEAHKLYMIP